jgi:hypothetical protein
MTCDRRLLSSYRDAQVSGHERYLVERHLQECADCRRELQGMVRVGQAIRSMAWEPVPTSIGHEVRRKIAERESARRRPLPVGGFARAFAPAAAFASVALSLVLVLRPGVGEAPLPLPSTGAVTSETGSVPADVPASQPVASQPLMRSPLLLNRPRRTLRSLSDPATRSPTLVGPRRHRRPVPAYRTRRSPRARRTSRHSPRRCRARTVRRRCRDRSVDCTTLVSRCTISSARRCQAAGR